MLKTIKISFICSLIATSSFAGICDYRPSSLLGGSLSGGMGSGAVATAGTGVAAVGIGAKAAGFYTLKHAVTGAWMLGSTAGGVSAAGTVGIMGGTAGLVGTMGTIIMAPVTIIAGITIGAGTAMLEGGCYFAVERVKDPEVILRIVKNMADNSNPWYFALKKIGEKSIQVASEFDENGKVLKHVEYKVSNLYIEEGMLKHRDFGPNTIIGEVGYVLDEQNIQK